VISAHYYGTYTNFADVRVHANQVNPFYIESPLSQKNHGDELKLKKGLALSLAVWTATTESRKEILVISKLFRENVPLKHLYLFYT
jgi:hypothetical protein